MISIKQAFANGKAFIGFLTAGDPNLSCTQEYIIAMAKAGADLIEIGLPFSDPVAEGETIQKANERALAVGTTTDKIFDMVSKTRQHTDIPLVILTYLNPVFTYGYDKFLANCKKSGVQGLIIPDLPYEEKDELLSLANSYDVELISLIAPTSQERTGMIAKAAQGFVYCVSSMGVTGVRNQLSIQLPQMLQAIRASTQVPVAVGFGIATPEQAKDVAKYADGIIVGSAIVKIIQEHGENAKDALSEYVAAMKKAISK